MKIHDIRQLAKKFNWVEEKARDPTVLIFHRVVQGDEQQVNVWHTRMTVATTVTHPRKGRNQLYRHSVDEELLAKIFEYPRVHTEQGYRSRAGREESLFRLIRKKYRKNRSRNEH